MPKARTARLLRRSGLLVVLALAVGAWAVQTRPWETKPVAVTVETLVSGPATEVLAVNGQLVPGEQVDLSAPVAGQVSEVLVQAGDLVQKGDLLGRLDPAIAEAALAQAEATLRSAKVDAEAARRENERAQALASTVSAQNRDSARFAVESAEARVAQLAAALEQARQQLAQTEIRAPIDGTVLTVDAELGEVVASTTSLFSIGDLARPLIETDVDEIYGARIRVGLAARVAPVGSQDGQAATVSFVAPVVDPDTGGRTLRLGFDTPPATPLPSGLTMSVNIEVERFADALTVPRSAVRDLDSTPWVLLDDGGVARRVPVQLRSWPAERLIVTDGLASGARLITSPADLAPGVAVAATPAAQ